MTHTQYYCFIRMYPRGSYAFLQPTLLPDYIPIMGYGLSTRYQYSKYVWPLGFCAEIEAMRERSKSKRMLEISLYDKERTIEAGTGIVNPWVALCWKEDLCPNRALLLSLFAEKKSATPYRRVGVKYGDIYG